MILLIGKSCSGKTTISKLIPELDTYYKLVVPYTTRPKRKNEVQGIDYIFATNDNFLLYKKSNLFQETSSFTTEQGVWHYGTLKSSYQKNSVIVLNPQSLSQIESKFISSLYYLKVSEETIKSRYFKNREITRESLKEYERRLMADRVDFHNIEEIVHPENIINCDTLNEKDIALEIISKDEQNKNERNFSKYYENN